MSNWMVSESSCLATRADSTVAVEGLFKAVATSIVRPCKVKVASTVLTRLNSPLPLKVYLYPSSVMKCGSPYTNAEMEKDNYGQVPTETIGLNW